MNYATFGQRFVALLIDAAIFVAISLLFALLLPVSKVADVSAYLLTAVAIQAYVVVGHGLFGQTLGKHLTGIRVVGIERQSITWGQAWLRSSVDVLFAIVSTLLYVSAVARIPDAEYFPVEWLQRAENLAARHPSWSCWVDRIALVWFWGELVVMLTNSRRRALHDFLAGTVVIPTVTCFPETQSVTPE